VVHRTIERCVRDAAAKRMHGASCSTLAQYRHLGPGRSSHSLVDETIISCWCVL